MESIKTYANNIYLFLQNAKEKYIVDTYKNIFKSFELKNIAGGCDVCSKMLKYTDDFIEIEMKNNEEHLLNLQICCDNCYQRGVCEYPYLKKLKFINQKDIDRSKVKSVNKLNMAYFTIKHPLTVKESMLKSSLWLYNYIICLKEKEDKTESEIVFLKDCEKYQVI